MRTFLITSGFLLLHSISLHAAPVTWYISGQFTDGGTISGSYVFDSSTTTFSSINITTTAGSAGAGYHYIAIHPTMLQDASHIRVVTLGSGDLSTAHYLAINLSSAMSGSGGTITVGADGAGVYSEFACSNSGCTLTTQYRQLSGATVTTTAPAAVPALSGAGMVSAAVLLLACALILIKRRPAQFA